MTAVFNKYKSGFQDIDGFFGEQAQALWDFLLSTQNEKTISGNFMEIGVWKGKSAILGSMYLTRGEVAILVDIGDVSEAVSHIHRASNCAIESHTVRSSQFWYSTSFRKYVGSIRWFHIDGDHSGFSTTNDLKIGSKMIGCQGIICVDDFFNIRYPQLAASVFRFLFDNPGFNMFLCGANKAFICRTEDYVFYESLVRHYLPNFMKKAGFSVTLAKTSYVHDMGCFAIEPRFCDRDIIGRDEDHDDIVF